MRFVRGDLRRETARAYIEMYEEGSEPFRGTWKSITGMLLLGAALMGSVLYLFVVAYAVPIEFLNDLLDGIFEGLEQALRSIFSG
jgi:hypothetical protein